MADVNPNQPNQPAPVNPTESLNLFTQGVQTIQKGYEDITDTVKEKIGFNPLELNKLNSAQYGENQGSYDILSDYNWTINGKRLRGNIPHLKLRQFQIDGNLLLANLSYWTKHIVDQDARNNPYQGLYKARPTGIIFRFPWLNSFNHAITQNWGDFKGLENTALGDIMSKVVLYASDTPGVHINTPKMWTGPSQATIPYEITLFNTGEPAQIVKNIDMNKKFINRLIMSTLHDQANAILALPPALYELEIQGVRVSPACVISNLQVENIGTIVLKNNRTVPEAHRIRLTITELISESRQIFDGVNGGKVVTAIEEIKPTEQQEPSQL